MHGSLGLFFKFKDKKKKKKEKKNKKRRILEIDYFFTMSLFENFSQRF